MASPFGHIVHGLDSRQNARAYSVMELHPINRGKEVISANQFMSLEEKCRDYP